MTSDDLLPNDIELRGAWHAAGVTGVMADATCHRIQRLVNHHLIRSGRDASGRDTLFRDPPDERLWELVYLQSEMHGGGPPTLRLITPETARAKYSDTV